MRLILASRGAERLRVDGAEPLGEDAEAPAAEDLAGIVERLVHIAGALDEDMGDREGLVQGERRAVPPGADLLCPELARDVHQDAAAVALAVHAAGAVEHLLEVGKRELHRRPARRGVLAHRGVDRAGVAVLHARRRDAGTIGPLGR